MRALADTHILLWWLLDPERMSERHHELLSNPDNLIAFSSISIAEVVLKRSVGKLELEFDVVPALRDQGFLELEFAAEHADRLRVLPWIHRDPFDRMLITQAQVEDIALMTVDEHIVKYDVRTV